MAFKFKYKSEEDLRRQFTQLRPQYEVFTTRLEETLERILDVANIPYATIESRTKSADSFIQKAMDPKKGYVNPLKSVTDISGVRIICYYHTDVEKIADLIASEFNIDERNSGDKSTALGINEFGYRSIHQIISFSKERKLLAENKAFSDFVAEVQTRTILQHAWASIEHKLNYKSDDIIPDEIKRRLYRISGLLDTADDEFLFVKRKITKIREAYREDLGKKQLVDVNIESLGVFLETIDDKAPIFKKAERYGYSLNAPHPNSRNSINALMLTLDLAEITTVSAFENIMTKPPEKVTKFLKQVFEKWKSVGNKPPKLVIDYYGLMRIAVIGHVGKKNVRKNILSRMSFGPELTRGITEAVSELD